MGRRTFNVPSLARFHFSGSCVLGGCRDQWLGPILSDPLLYQKVFHAADVELSPTARGEFSARLTQIRLNKIWMQRADETLPRVLLGGEKCRERTTALIEDIWCKKIRSCSYRGGNMALPHRTMLHRTIT